VYEAPLAVDLGTLSVIAGGVIVTVLAIGASSSRAVYRKPALEVLRAET
jgi:hypothetical protein